MIRGHLLECEEIVESDNKGLSIEWRMDVIVRRRKWKEVSRKRRKSLKQERYVEYDRRLGGRYECLSSLTGELSKVEKEMNVEVRGVRENKKEWFTEVKGKIKERKEKNKKCIEEKIGNGG